MIPIYGRARPAWIGIFAVDAQQRQPPRSPGGLAFHTGALCSSFNALYLLSSPAPAGKHKKEETHMKRTKHSILNTRSLVMMAALVAIQIVLARYLAIQVSETLRVSFETVPLALAGMWLGPVAGVLVALISDILGTIIYGYGVWFPPIALGPMFFAFLCGVGAKYFNGGRQSTRNLVLMVTTVVVAGIINSFVIGLVTTTWYQMIVVGKEGAFTVLAWANFLSRLASKPAVIALNTLVVFLIDRAAYRPVVSRIVPRPQA